ncbi:5\'-AMP-activated protein kinase beta-2 subunit protein isoform 1 [Theobroma cacao]|uniref:5\'-AMP-activated protein kinase beta-2 subunit protein isoform 1 n=1 Tax=Theobroma cacao TaxID=3641 RepID=A0A061H082_THECC|nr:5\'-AMP-activated protein kinase beta-2 subunit protein isoform 1 [Theobroma cacao]
MGNANGREDGANGGVDDLSGRSNGGDPVVRGAVSAAGAAVAVRVPSSDSMANTPPQSPSRSRSPLLFAPQAPVAPLPRGDGHSFFNQIWRHDSTGVADCPSEKGIPVIITWNYGGNDVAVEGSWDNWRSRKTLQRAGKDHSILLVLPSGIYHYKFIIDGEWRYTPDLPFVADEMGHVCNILDVHDYVPENLDSVTEFETPGSPNSSYGQALPREEDFAKEPVVVPSQLHLTVLGTDTQDGASSSKPQHVVLNHLFIEKGWASQSVVALGLTHRFESKYVTVVLYKPLKRNFCHLTSTSKLRRLLCYFCYVWFLTALAVDV